MIWQMLKIEHYRETVQSHDQKDVIGIEVNIKRYCCFHDIFESISCDWNIDINTLLGHKNQAGSALTRQK